MQPEHWYKSINKTSRDLVLRRNVAGRDSDSKRRLGGGAGVHRQGRGRAARGRSQNTGSPRPGHLDKTIASSAMQALDSKYKGSECTVSELSAYQAHFAPPPPPSPKRYVASNMQRVVRSYGAPCLHQHTHAYTRAQRSRASARHVCACNYGARGERRGAHCS